MKQFISKSFTAGLCLGALFFTGGCGGDSSGSASGGANGPQPLVTITVSNFEDLAGVAGSVVTAVNPELAAMMDPSMMLQQSLGAPGLQGVDSRQPWQVALWWNGSEQEQPFAALKVPVSDYETFQENLMPGGALMGVSGANTLERVGSYAVVGFTDLTGGNVPDSYMSDFEGWKSASVGRPDDVMTLFLKMSDPVRVMIVEKLAEGEAAIEQQMVSNPGLEAMGNPEATQEIMGLYFSGIRKFLEGLDEMSVGVSLESDNLVFSETVAALSGSDLSGVLQAQDGGDFDDVIFAADGESAFSVGMKVAGSSELLLKWKEFALMGYEMQGLELGEAFVLGLDTLMQELTPMAFAGSGGMENGMTFSGAYAFEDISAEDAYAKVRAFFDEHAPSMSGEGQMYSTMGFEDAVETVDGTQVDRFSMTVNFNHPMFEMEGQKETFEGMWPDGKIEFDYAVKDDRMLIASTGQMEHILQRLADGETGLEMSPDRNTVLFGEMNVLKLAEQGLAMNPLTQTMTAGLFSMMDMEGTEIQFSIGLDGQLDAKAQVPLKLIQQVAQVYLSASNPQQQ